MAASQPFGGVFRYPGSINLNRLDDVFQVVMGWTNSHLHQFLDAPIVYCVPSGDYYSRVERLDERRFRLADVARHEKASFIYCSASGEAEHKLGAIRFSSRKELFRESGIKRVLFQYS